jgi:hypothetical protein
MIFGDILTFVTPDKRDLGRAAQSDGANQQIAQGGIWPAGFAQG